MHPHHHLLPTSTSTSAFNSTLHFFRSTATKTSRTASSSFTITRHLSRFQSPSIHRHRQFPRTTTTTTPPNRRRPPPFPSSSSFHHSSPNHQSAGGGTGPNPTPGRSPLRVWPFVLITLIGTTTYISLVQSRAATKERDRQRALSSSTSTTSTTMPHPSPPPPPPPALPSPPTQSQPRLSSPDGRPTPTFSPANTTVLFVLGGPGAGKGTQCAKLVRDYGFVHLSAGDLLRAEQDRPGSQFGGLIRRNIRDGVIVPMEVTVALLENAMMEATMEHEARKGKGKGARMFLIDGFPRKMDQALHFEASVCPSRFTLFFDAPEEVLLRRLTNRAKTSGREDDNPDSITKRFRTFEDTSMPVVKYFEGRGKVVRIDATGNTEQVYEIVRRRLREWGIVDVQEQGQQQEGKGERKRA